MGAITDDELNNIWDYDQQNKLDNIPCYKEAANKALVAQYEFEVSLLDAKSQDAHAVVRTAKQYINALRAQMYVNGNYAFILGYRYQNC